MVIPKTLSTGLRRISNAQDHCRRNNEQQLGRHVSALVDPLPGPVKALEGIRVRLYMLQAT